MEKSLSIRYHSKKIFLLIGLLVLGVTLIQLADAALAQGTERPSRSDGQRLIRESRKQLSLGQKRCARR